MCWTPEVTMAMVGAGAIATVITARRDDLPREVPLTLAFFIAMEALQVWGYAVVDQCGTPENRVVTVLSMAHIVIQPIVINLFALALMGASAVLRRRVVLAAMAGSAVMVVQLLPIPAFGPCTDGAILCALQWCTVSGDWHIGWEVAYNGLLAGPDRWTLFGFPTYMLATFGLPLLYGAWRFALFQLLFGPVLAGMLTTDPHEVPAIWCLFSIGLTILSLSPVIRGRVIPRAAQG